MDDADTLVNTTDAPFRFYPCMVAGLAYYVAMKKSSRADSAFESCVRGRVPTCGGRRRGSSAFETSAEYPVFKG